MLVVSEEINYNLEKKLEEKLNGPYGEYYLLNYDAENNVLANLRKDKKKPNNQMGIIMGSKYISIKKSVITKDDKVITPMDSKENNFIGNAIAKKLFSKK